MEAMQKAKLGYLAVSLGSYKTFFSSPGRNTSSEIPENERIQMNLTVGLVRISLGLDDDIDQTYQKNERMLKRNLDTDINPVNKMHSLPNN
jgi:methionine-gamma-lyase